MASSNLSKRKSDHLKLAKSAQYTLQNMGLTDHGLTYEPLLARFPEVDFNLSQKIVNKTIQHPLWISSMTGGSAQSGKINKKLAAVAKYFNIGMGLGSCRIIMEQPASIKDFDLRAILGNAPFWANLGICEVDSYLHNPKKWKLFKNIIQDLDVDGLFIHINPTQEFLQAQGSKLLRTPLTILSDLISLEPKLHIIVKEVGQGFGPKSLKALSQLPIRGIEFASLGGTNFASLELTRNKENNIELNPLNALTKLGHSAKEMVDFWIKQQGETQQLVNWHVIISGGRGSDVTQDVALFKKLTKINQQQASVGLGFSILSQAYKGEKNLNNWLEDYLKSFYYLYNFTHLI